MRVADELTAPPQWAELPAPTGLPAPAGQQPAMADHLPINPTQPTGPRLPPRPARVDRPPTAQIPVTAAAAATAALFTQSIPVTVAQAQPAKRRGTKKWIALLLLVITGSACAFVFRHSPLADRITGKGYDTNPLPLRSFSQPTFDGAEYTWTFQDVSEETGLPTNYWEIQHDTVNYSARAAKVTVDRAKASIIGGTIGTPVSTAPTSEIVMDGNSTYEPGATPTDAWTRHAHVPGSPLLTLSRNEVWMYQDVFDPALRNLTPTKVVHESRHSVPVTTYVYTMKFGDFYESAPTLFDASQMIDGNAADDADLTITVSLDSQWIVRYVDVNLDYDAVIEHRAKADPTQRFTYRITIDLIAITDKPENISIPSNVVDAPAETIPTLTGQ